MPDSCSCEQKCCLVKDNMPAWLSTISSSHAVLSPNTRMSLAVHHMRQPIQVLDQIMHTPCSPSRRAAAQGPERHAEHQLQPSKGLDDSIWGWRQERGQHQHPWHIDPAAGLLDLGWVPHLLTQLAEGWPARCQGQQCCGKPRCIAEPACMRASSSHSNEAFEISTEPDMLHHC